MAVGDPDRAPVHSGSVVGARQERPDVVVATDAPRPLRGLETLLGHRFGQPKLLAQAVIHPSATEQPGTNNQRLEFFGDRVLGMVVAAMLYERFPAEEEGALALRFTALVRRETLADVARQLDLGAYLTLAKGEAEGGGRDKPANLSDACEAIMAALYLDGGLAAAESFIRRYWTPLMNRMSAPPRDSKTALQEWAQGERGVLPIYRTVSMEGAAHAPIFEVEVSIDGLPPTKAKGGSKRAAEQAAAKVLLARLERRDG